MRSIIVIPVVRCVISARTAIPLPSEDAMLPETAKRNKALAEAALAAQDWAVMNEKRAAQSKEVKAGREAESLRSEYGAT